MIYYNLRTSQDKIPMNLLTKVNDKQVQPATSTENSFNLDLNYLLKPQNNLNPILSEEIKPTQDTTDDFLVDISDEKMLEVEKTLESHKSSNSSQESDNKNNQNVIVEKNVQSDIKLSDIIVKLENIKPSSIPPITMLDNKTGISVTLHLAKDKPKERVNVYVLTTISRMEMPISNYLFQAVVPKVRPSLLLH